MARLTAAGFVCAVALVALCVEVTPGNGDDQLILLRSLTPVRIVYKKDVSLCVGVGTNTTIVLVWPVGAPLLVNTQLWVLHTPSLTADVDGSRKPFALVNVESVLTSQPKAIQTPSDGSYFPLQLAPYDITNVPESMLWIKGPKSSNPLDPFVKIKLFRNESWFLDGWEKDTSPGTKVAVFPATHEDPNIYWATKIFNI